MSDKIKRDFYARSAEEQNDFLAMTWCNACMQADLGMVEPEEYELADTIFIEGKCRVCGGVVTTELSFDED